MHRDKEESTTSSTSSSNCMSGLSSTSRCRWLAIAILLLTILQPIRGKHVWDEPGCHRTGHTRTIKINGCVEFDVTTNSCRGYCESFSVPSMPEVAQPKHVITSYGECCSMIDTEDVKVKVRCVGGYDNLVFKSAVTCKCYNCKKD